MTSTQDIETRLIGIENMLKFAFSVFAIQEPNNPFARPVTLLAAYQRACLAGFGQPTIEAEVVEVHTDQPDGSVASEQVIV